MSPKLPLDWQHWNLKQPSRRVLTNLSLTASLIRGLLKLMYECGFENFVNSSSIIFKNMTQKVSALFIFSMFFFNSVNPVEIQKYKCSLGYFLKCLAWVARVLNFRLYRVYNTFFPDFMVYK